MGQHGWIYITVVAEFYNIWYKQKYLYILFYFQMMNVNDLEERDDTNDSSVGTPGDGMDGRATMVPPSGLNYVSFLLFKRNDIADAAQ